MALTDMVDYVDDDDNVIGTASIQDVRAKGLIHRIVRVMILNKKRDKILLQKRTDNKPLWPGCWDNSAAGHVDAGEDYLSAAKRELKEEVGIDTTDLVQIGKYIQDISYQGQRLRRFNVVYEHISNETPSNLEASEVEQVKWFKVSEAIKLVEEHPGDITDGLKDVINRYYK